MCPIIPEQYIEVTIKFLQEYFKDKSTTAVIGISGGKDSTIAAALLARAIGPERVIGVLMPNGKQSDFADAMAVINALGIRHEVIPIGGIFQTALSELSYSLDADIVKNSVITSNIPARIRMMILYSVAATCHGRVCNTGNLSERWVGYTTKYGDLAGDFALFTDLTATEVVMVGDALKELPKDLIHKEPADGLSGLTDADNLGFTYEELDNYLLYGKEPEHSKCEKIIKKHNQNLHKYNLLTLPKPPLQEGINIDF